MVSFFLQLLVITGCISWPESNYNVMLCVERRGDFCEQLCMLKDVYIHTIDLVPVIMDDKKSHNPLSAGL